MGMWYMHTIAFWVDLRHGAQDSTHFLFCYLGKKRNVMAEHVTGLREEPTSTIYQAALYICAH